MNIHPFLFLAQQTLPQQVGVGVSLILLFVAMCGVAALGYGVFEVIAHRNMTMIGYAIIGAVVAACSLAIINFLFAGQVQLHPSGNLGLVLSVWK